MKARAAVCIGVILTLYVLGWWALGAPIQRGLSGLAFYIGLLVCVVVGFMANDSVPWEKPQEPEPEEAPLIPGIPPGDKARMRTAILQGVLESIKGLVHRSEECERRLKEVEHRMSELSLAAGLKPRTAARAVAEQKAP